MINTSDNNWTTILKNISANEIITMDCKNEILTSSIEDRLILNDFNMHFMRFVSGVNKIHVNSDVTLEISFVYPRKVGFV
jgi:phage-related protein